MEIFRFRSSGVVRAVSLLVGLAVPLVLQAEEPEAEEESSPVHISREADGVIVLTLSVETQERIAMKIAEVETKTLQPMVVAHGRIEQDPAGTFALRAPIAGVLRTASGRDWPGIGSALEPGTTLGYVEPRFTPLELADVQSRYMDALADVEEAQADLEASRTSFENKSRLNTEGGLVSDRSLEETRARYRSSEARLGAAQHKASLYESLVQGQGQASSLFPIQVPGPGEVFEVAARPGEVVDSAQVLLRTTSSDTLIARVSLFVGDFVEPPLVSAQIIVSGMEKSVLVGEPIGVASEASAMTGGQVLLYRVRVSTQEPIRPGSALLAYIPTSGSPMTGVIIPRSSILRHGGRTWVYIQTDENRFERRDCELQTPTNNGWFAIHGVSSGERVVVEGAQMLLSEELKSQIESEEEAEE